MRIAPFQCDVTPPIGHPLCGGWIAPVKEIVDRQFAHGIVLIPEDADPIILLAVDWCWIRTEAHAHWREVLADAVKTQPNRVAVQCVHQHDALMADPAADRILAASHLDLRTLRGDFFEKVVVRCADAARAALASLQRVTHLGVGAAKVEQVASNRRILGPDGKVGAMRGSSCKDAELRAAPEGLIDPWLRCISFWNGKDCLAALHYYATHPMSYYGEGGVSADFVGIARERLRREQRVAHIYFTGCAGNIAAGKYNDGSRETRPLLTERIYRGMSTAFAATRRTTAVEGQWSVEPLHLPMSTEFTRTFFDQSLHNENASAATRIIGAMGLAWWDWFDAGKKVDLTCLRMDDVSILHLPGEPFVEYQLEAQAAAGEPREFAPAEGAPFVAVAGYGDCGPAYIPVAAAYPQSGYEVTMAWVGPKAEEVITGAVRRLLNARDVRG